MNESYSWHKVQSNDFGDLELGEVYGGSANLVGRHVNIAASELKELKSRPGYKLGFVISAVGEDSCKAELNSLLLSREQLSRLVRHNITKMDVVVPVDIDGRRYFVKVLCALSKTERRYEKAVRKEIADTINSEVKELKLKDLVTAVLANKLQNALYKKVNKIYPSRVLEVRAIQPMTKSARSRTKTAAEVAATSTETKAA